MPGLGVNAAILKDGAILLTLRKDFEVWCLPGGEIDPDESPAQAAMREAREETGLDVELTYLIGIYSRPGWFNHGLHIIAFAAVPVGGQLQAQESEVLDLRYFRLEELPQDMLFGHRQRAVDALNGARGVAWWQPAEWTFDPSISRQELYQRMEQSGLPRSEFYFRYVGKPAPEGDRLEVK